MKAVIFDCDGTLVDSEQAYFGVIREIFHEKGVDLSIDEYRFCIGRSSGPAELVAQKMGKEWVGDFLGEVLDRYRRLQAVGIAPIQPTVDFLCALAREKERLDLKLGLASASARVDILKILENLKLTHFFDVILSGEDDLAEYDDPMGVNKPKPYIYLHAAKLLRVEPAECVAIEDSHSGVTAAADAGCFTVAVPNVHTQKHDLSRAHLHVESFAGVSVDMFLEKCVKIS